MFINTLDIPGYSRLNQILHTLKHVHQFEFDSHDGDQLQETQQHYLHVQQQIVETSAFNTYHVNPEYAKAALITEAIKMLLEIAPKRRKKAAVQETKKKQPKPDFLDVDKDGNKKEPFKKAVADKAKAGKLDEKWGTEMKTSAKDMGKWEGYTKADLQANQPGFQEGMMKNVKRGLFGWPSPGLPGGRSGGKPQDVVARTRAMDDDMLKSLASNTEVSPGSPAGLQKKVAQQELRRRGKAVSEAWGTEMKTSAKDIGKWEGYTITELKARKKKLMDKEERTAAESKEVRQINFAIRAKQENSWGKVKESMLMEDENLDKAETLLAAKDLSDRLQDMAEDAAKMAVDRLMPLVDVMKSQFGQEPADAFNQIVKAQLQTVLDTIISAKDQTDNAVLTLQGGGVPSMGSDISQPLPGAEAPAAEPGTEAPAAEPQVGGEEEFQAGPATAGPEEEPLGRSMKEPMSETLRVGDLVKFAFVRGMTPIRGTILEFVSARKTLANPHGFMIDVQSGNTIYSIHPQHAQKLANQTISEQKIARRIIKESHQQCMECGQGWYMEDQHGKMQCNECGSSWIGEDQEQDIEKAKKEYFAKGGKITQGPIKKAKGSQPYMPGTYHGQRTATMRAHDPFKRKMEESAKPKDIITDANDRRRYIALRNMEADHYAQARKTKDTKQAHHKKMAQQYNDQANDILDKYRSSVEEAQQPNATQTIQDMAAKGKDATGKPLSPSQKMAAKKAADELAKANLEEKLTKKMTAGEIISDFVNSDDPKFKGKSKAERTRMALGAYYDMHPEKSKKQESYNNVKAVVESLTTEFNNLKMQFQQHKKIFQESVRHGATFDILNEGYGLEGAAILEQMKQIKTQLDTHRANLTQLRTEIQEQFALDQTIVTKVQKLSEQAKTLPYGIVGVLNNQQKFRKFFINESQRNTWIEYNQEYIKESTLVDPQDLDRVQKRLKDNI